MADAIFLFARLIRVNLVKVRNGEMTTQATKLDDDEGP